MRRTWLQAVTLLASGLIVTAGGAPLTSGAQGAQAADLDIRIVSTTLERGRTSTIVVELTIPETWFVPAETRGLLGGAWVRPATSGLLDRDLAMFPVPAETRLPGTDGPLLAYSGTVSVRVPVAVAPGLSGPTNVEVHVGYQLCDTTRCLPFRLGTAEREMTIRDPVTAPGSLAFRVDESTVAILVDRSHPVDRSLSFAWRMPGFVQPLEELPEGHPARAGFRDDGAVGSRWQLLSSHARFDVTGSRPAAMHGGCGDMSLALMGEPRSTAFADEPAKFFLALPAGLPVSDPPRRIARSPRLTADQRRELEALIDGQMRITLPGLFAPDPLGHDRPAVETGYERRVREGEGRLAYHLEAWSVAPDEHARLYVRAHWALNGLARIGLTLWIRFDGRSFVVEQSSAAVSRMARYMRRIFGNTAERPEFAGMLLNVIPQPDGWAYVIMGRSGYESSSVTVRKYSPNGPMDTGIVYAHGC